MAWSPARSRRREIVDFTTAAIVCLCGMIFLLMLGVPIAYSIGFVSVVIGWAAFGDAGLEKMGRTTFLMLYRMSWTPLPLFTLLACIIAQTRMGEDIFGAAKKWLSRVPGGLVVSTVFGEAVMAAALGSSTPTIIAMGKVAEPEFERYRYDKPFAVGATVAGGVLGPLIPPSTTMIIFSVMSNCSLGTLMIAGVLPGIFLAVMLAGTAVLLCVKNPALGPRAGSVPWKERIASLKNVWPIIVVMIAILGSIYAGIATPTEAGGIGCFAVLVIAVLFYGLRWKGLFIAMKETARLNAMILLVLVAANFFAYIVGSSDLTERLADLVVVNNVPDIVVVIMVMIVLLILGCFIDGLTIMMLTIPLFVPLLTSLGYDPIWLGILYVVNMEIGLITPPMGLNLFVARNTFGVPTGALIKGVLPFLATLIIFLFVLVVWQGLALWLPSLM
jgi:C4-dicarboxylate transporter, DctM subunit